MAKKKKIHFKESIGLDIGTHSIKLVHLKHQHNNFKLLNYDVRSTIPEGLEQTPSDLSPDRFAPVLASMLKSLKINPKKVKHLVSSIGGDNTSIKQIKTIFLPDDELESALFFEAKKHLPISGSEMILDFQVLSVEERTNNMNILLASATKTLLSQHTDILTAVGLTPGIVDIESLAVANSFLLNTFFEDGVYILLNIGAFKSNLVIFGPKSKYFARDIAWGGYHFTKDIMKKNKVSFEEAENQKLDNGLKHEQKKDDASSLLSLDISEKSTEEQLAMEVKRSLRYYVKDAGNSNFQKIVIVGGGSKLKGLPEYLQSQLNIDVEVFSSFSNLETSSQFSGNIDPQFALALGLAMREE
ncbi:MAG: type IV pilus assembly protein PilM [Candidatus Cloacimonetes bacterium]|nr:type IV pilus assembly protein PilM [Candidatus Cloacimonadota bacterium]